MPAGAAATGPAPATVPRGLGPRPHGAPHGPQLCRIRI